MIDFTPEMIEEQDESTLHILSNNIQGISVLDTLLLDQIKSGNMEQLYIIYEKRGLLGRLKKSSKVGFHKAKSQESSLLDLLDQIENGNLSSLETVANYLEDRIKDRSKIRGGLDLAALNSLRLAQQLKQKYNPELATELKQVMKKNVFSRGIKIEPKDIPKYIKKRVYGSIHFHVYKKFVPPSDLVHDLSLSQYMAVYVGSYSSENKATKLFSIHNGKVREMGILPNSKKVNELMNPIVERPVSSLRKIGERVCQLGCSSDEGLRSVHIYGYFFGEGHEYISSFELEDKSKHCSIEIKLPPTHIPNYVEVFVLDQNYNGRSCSIKVR